LGEKIRNRLADGSGVERTLARLAYEIVEKNRGTEKIALIGIRTRGAPLAERLARIISGIEGNAVVPVGILDITLYRDDFSKLRKNPRVQATEIAFDVQDRILVLVDDVLFTGRTIRSAIDALLDYGRPLKIQLAVLVDRGHREMPIQGDFVGMKVIASPGEEVVVHLNEIDGIDEILLVEKDNG
jgi:pyrimidine operon attenuation protein/uracil phosphoribosyltransferase